MKRKSQWRIILIGTIGGGVLYISGWIVLMYGKPELHQIASNVGLAGGVASIFFIAVSTIRMLLDNRRPKPPASRQ
jgi:hypothetical protein